VQDGCDAGRQDAAAVRLISRHGLACLMSYNPVVEGVEESARARAFARLRDLIAIGHRYEMFARQHPMQAEAQIAELNAPGLRGHAWDLLWVPRELRFKIAGVSSLVVLDLCGPPEDPMHDPALMDVIMPAAIVAACLVARTYGRAPQVPGAPLAGRLDTLGGMLRRVVVEQPEELEVIARARGGAPPNAQPPIVACLPSRVRDRLIGLAHIMAAGTDPIRLKIVTAIFIIGAVAAESFESLDFCAVDSRP